MATADAGSTPERVPLHLRPNYKWVVVAMLWFMCFFNYADRQAVFAMQAALARDMHFTLVMWGWLGASFGLVYGIFAPFAGNVGDRFRRKSVILAGLYAWSLICALTALSRSFATLIFFRAAEGLGETFYFPATTSLISDYHGKRTRSRALGTHNTGVYMGTIFGAFFAAIISQRYGWRASFIVFGALGILLGLVLMKFIVEPRRGMAERAELGADAQPAPAGDVEQHAAARSPLISVVGAMLAYAVILGVWILIGYRLAQMLGWRAVWAGVPAGVVLGALPGVASGLYAALYIAHGRSGIEFLRWVWGTPSMLVLMLVFMGANGVALVPLTWLPKFVSDKFHLEPAWAALGGTFPIFAANMVGAPIGGYLADLLRRRTPGGRMIVQACALIIGAPFVYLAGATPAFGVFIAALVFWGLLKGVYDASIFASAFDVVPPQFRGTAAGFMNMAGWLGGAPLPVLVGYIATRSSESAAIASASSVYVAAGVIMILGALAFAKRDAARMEQTLKATLAA